MIVNNQPNGKGFDELKRKRESHWQPRFGCIPRGVDI